jgi:Peptidase family S41
MPSMVRMSCVACSLVVAVTTARSASDTPGTVQSFAPAELHSDFRILRQSLEQGSPGLYRHTSKEDFDRICRRAEKALDRPLSSTEFFRVVAPVVAAVKNGHTQIHLPEAESQELDVSIPLLPLGVRVLGGRIFVVRDFSGYRPSLAGAEIRAINGVSARFIIDHMLAAVSADGDVKSSRQRIISGWGFSHRLFSLLALRDKFALTLRDPKSGADRRATVSGMPGKALAQTWSELYPRDLEANNRRPFLLTFSDKDRIAHMAIPSWPDFVDPDKAVSIQDFFRNAFSEIRMRKTQVLIIDVRDNGGGEDSYGTLLASYLLATPFEYFSDIWMKGLSFEFLRYAEDAYHIPSSTKLPREITDLAELGPDRRYHLTKRPNWGRQPPSQPGFQGRLYVLINGNSFSTSAEFAAFLWARRRAEFIGEESSGYWRCNTSGPDPTVTLPATKLRLTVPLVEFDLAVSDGTPGAHGVQPDYEVGYTVDDLLAGTDKELDLAFRLARTFPESTARED